METSRSNPIQPFIDHGYRMPIPRSPSVYFTPPSPPRTASPIDNLLQDEQDYKYFTYVQAARESKEDEDIPAPYAYTAIMCPDIDRQALKAKFMHHCNQRRWQHIQQAEVKAKK